MSQISSNTVQKLIGVIKKLPASATTALDTEATNALEAAMQEALVGVLSTYAVDGAIALTDRTAKLTKGSAGAYTLAAPTAAMEGQRLVITSNSAYAHVVTATNLINDGVTGGAKDTMTFGASVGASIELIAIGSLWSVVGKNVVTIA